MFTNMKYTGHLLALASVASAHYTFSKISVNGEVQGSDWTYIREHTRGYMPTKGQEILENDFRCQPGGDSGANTQVLTVNAGDEVDFQGAFGMTSIEHPGPAQVYFSKAPGDDVQSYVGQAFFFKRSKWLADDFLGRRWRLVQGQGSSSLFVPGGWRRPHKGRMVHLG